MLACGLLAVLVITLFLQVLFRYVLQLPLAWTEEVARFALVWYAMLAAGIAARSGQQFVFRWVSTKLPTLMQGPLRQVVNLATLAFLVLLLFQSLTYLDIVRGQFSAAAQIDMRLPYAGITAGVLYLIVVYSIDSFDALCGLLTKQRFSLQEAHEREMHAMLVTPLHEMDSSGEADTSN